MTNGMARESIPKLINSSNPWKLGNNSLLQDDKENINRLYKRNKGGYGYAC